MLIPIYTCNIDDIVCWYIICVSAFQYSNFHLSTIYLYAIAIRLSACMHFDACMVVLFFQSLTVGLNRICTKDMSILFFSLFLISAWLLDAL